MKRSSHPSPSSQVLAALLVGLFSFAAQAALTVGPHSSYPVSQSGAWLVNAAQYGAPWSVSGSGVFDVTPAVPLATDYLPCRLTDGTSFYVAGGGGGATPATYVVAVRGLATAALVANTRRDVLSIEHSALSTKTVKIVRIDIGGYQTTAVAGTVEFNVYRGTAASTAGTARTPELLDSTNPAVEAVVKTLPTIVAATQIGARYVITLAATANTGYPTQTIYGPDSPRQNFTLVAGQLQTLVVGMQSTGAQNHTLSVNIYFTEE